MGLDYIDIELLTYYDRKIKNWIENAYKIAEQVIPEPGCFKTYVLKTNRVETENSAKINIPKGADKPFVCVDESNQRLIINV